MPRQIAELTSRIDRFVVGVDGRGSIVACGELAPLSSSVAEIRSLVVTEKRRGQGIGRRIVDELRARARASGFDDLCVFAHEPGYFAHMGFSIVPHTWVPEKIMADCRNCALFRRCEQFAMVTDLDAIPEVQSGATCMSNATTRAETRIQAIDGGITAPAGFKAAGVYAGIKPPTHAWPLDVMVLTAEAPVSAAAVFTTNQTQAAPVVVSRANLQSSGGRAKAIVCNSGCANACTGDAGMEVARSTVEFVGRQARVPAR